MCGLNAADAEERSVFANSHPNDKALPHEYVMTLPMALPCGGEKDVV